MNLESGVSQSSRPPSSHPWAAVLSALLPGSGHLLIRRNLGQASGVFLWASIFFACFWSLWSSISLGMAILFAMLVVLPWWCIQTYQAYLPFPQGFKDTVRLIWDRAHDIRYLGGLFILTACTDLYIIVANPEYALTIFCTKPTGIVGLLAKAQSPTLHLIIGYGFLGLRRWSLLVYLVYAGFGLVNAAANFACFGYGRIRTVFLITLTLFTIYILLRRGCFEKPAAPR